MLQVLAGILMFVSSCLVGRGLSTYYSRRVKFFGDYIDFINFTSSEINFYRSELLQLIEKFTKDRQGDFCDFLLKKSEGKLILKQSDTALVNEFLDGISQLDLNSQKGFASLSEEKARKLLREAEGDVKQKGAVINKLAPLMGLVLFIIII